MQTLVSKKAIEEDQKKDGLLQILSDRYCRKIIETTMNGFKSATQIASDANIPISTVYRRIQALHENKALRITGMISDDGKKYFLYKSRIRSILTSFDGSHIEVQIVPNSKDGEQS